MERYKLSDLYTQQQFKITLNRTIVFNIPSTSVSELSSFIENVIYGYFYDDLVAYEGIDAESVKATFMQRLNYDISVKFAYWYRKYNQVKSLLTTNDLSLLQTSKVVSSSSDNTDSASGSLQKIATTPTGVALDGASDGFEITIDDGDNSVVTEGFVDKYTNTQQKYASSNKIVGSRSGEITREGSIDELLNVLEKLPSSFADEINKEVGKHFIFDYDGERKGYYNETN